MFKKVLTLAAFAASALEGNLYAQTWTGNEPAEGTFFLYNVGADKFINNGDPNSEWGTNAYLQKGFGLDIKFESNAGAYNLNTNVSNGGDSHYLATSTWCDGAPTPWTFTAVAGLEKTYTISNGESYLVANNELNDIVYAASTGDEKSYWKLVTLEDFKEAMRNKVYSTTDPMDVSVFIQGRSFARNDGRNASWTTQHDKGNWTWIGGTANKYYGNEAWNNTFSVSQELTGLPEGTYEVQCSGFGTNGTTYIFGNTTAKVLQTNNATDRGNNKEAKWIAIHEDNAFAGQSTGTFTVGDGKLNLGLKRETNIGGDWCVYDEFRLYFYGLDLSEFAASLVTAVNKAKSTEGTIPTALYNLINAVVTEKNKTYTSAAAYTEAINAIEEAITTNASAAIVKDYTRYQTVKAAIKAINNGIDLSSADTQAEAATTIEALDEAVVTARQVLANYLPTVSLGVGQTIDLTDALIDNAAPGVSGNTDYWTNSGSPSLQFQLFEYYKQSGATTKQTIGVALPAGTYKLTAVGYTRTGFEAKLNAGENSINIATVSSSEVNVRETGSQWIAAGNGVTNLAFVLEEATSNLEIGLTAYNGSGDNWMCWRSFRLIYGDIFDPYTLVTGKMNAEVATAQTAADATFKSAKTVANYNAVMAAIEAAQASVDAYSQAAAALEKGKAILESTNVYTAEAYTKYSTAINNAQAAYDEGTLADADATALNGKLTGVGELVQQDHKNVATDYVSGAWSATNGVNIYTNFWSGEGNAEGSSGMTTPFIEDWVVDANKLADTEISATLSVPTGLYKVSAFVRVMNKKTAEGDTGYDGISFQVNEGVAVAFADATEYPDGFAKTVEFEGLVKDGSLVIKATIAGTNASWLAMKNVKYTKVRDLTPDEEFTYADEADYTALNAAIATAEGKVLGFEDGEYAPYNNVEASALLAAAKAIDQTGKNIQEDVQAATAALASATWTANDGEVNAVFDGSFEYDYSGQTGNVNPIGWQRVKDAAADGYNVRYMGGDNAGLAATSSNKALFTKQSAYYGYADGYTMPLKANTYYKVTFIYGGWGDCKKDGYVSVADPVGAAVTLSSSDLPLDATNADADASVWKSYEAIFQTGDAGNYVLGLRKKNYDTSGQSQYVYGDIVLVRATDAEVADLELKGLLDEMMAVYKSTTIPTANIGTGAFQYNATVVAQCQALVGQYGSLTTEEAKAALQAEGYYNKPKMTELIVQGKALVAAMQTLNPADATKLYSITNNSDGYNYAGNAVTFKSASDADLTGNTTTMGYNEVPGSAYPQGITFTAVEGVQNGYTLSYTRADGTTIYVGTGKSVGYVNNGNDNQLRPTTDAEKAAVMQVKASATEEGVWNLYNVAANCNVGANGANDQGFFTVDKYTTFALQEAVEATVALSIDAENQFATAIVPFDAAKPEGVTVYSVAVINGESLELTPATAIEANVPYIFEATAGADVSLSGYGARFTDDAYTVGLLTGVYAATVAPAGTYVLQDHDGQVAFYQVESEGDITVPAGKAYLQLAEESEVKAIFFPGDEATAISGIASLTSAGVKGIYNAAGAKVNSLQKGVNIVKTADGKTLKVYVK